MMKVENVNKEANVEDMRPLADQVVLYKCLISEGVYLNRLYPPVGKYFLDIAVYKEARDALSIHAIDIDRNSSRVEALNQYFGENKYDLGFGVYQSDTRIDIFTVGDCGLESYFEEQINCFDFPYVDESREDSMSSVNTVMSFLGSDPLGEKFIGWLTSGFPVEVVSPLYKRLLPEMLAITPLEMSYDECVMWIMMIEKLSMPTCHDLLVASMDDVHPFTGDKIGLGNSFYSKYLAKDTCLLDCLLKAESSLVKHFPVIAVNPLVEVCKTGTDLIN